MYFEARGTFLVGIVAEQDLLEIAKRRRRVVGLEVFAETTHVIADEPRVIIDDEHPGSLQRL